MVRAPAESRAFGPWLTALLGLLVTAIAGGGLAYHRIQQRELRRREDETLAAIADLKVAQIRHWRSERLADAQYVRWTPYATRRALDVLNQRGSATTRQMFTSWLRPLLAAGEFEQVLLCDTNLNVVLSVPDQPAPPLHDSLRRAAEKAILSREFVATDLYREGEGGVVRWSLVVPMVTQRGQGRDTVAAAGMEEPSTAQSAGLLVLQLNAAKTLYPILEGWPTPTRSAETLLVRRERDEVLLLNDLRDLANGALRVRLPPEGIVSASVLSGRTASRAFSGRDHRGVAVRAAAERVPGTSWTLIAKVDEAELYAPLRRQGWMTAAVVVISAVAAVLGLGLSWRQRELALERRRHESDRQFRVLFEQAAVGVARTDSRTGRILQVNQRYCDLLASTEEEVLQSDFQSYTHPDDLAADLEQMEQLKAGRIREFTMEKRYVRRDHSMVWVTLTVSPLWSPGETPSTHIAVIQDITERKRTESEREELIKELQVALASIRTLSGLLPICSACKKIRNDAGYWQSVEGYVQQHSDARFSHGLCPDCLRTYYPDVEPSQPAPAPAPSPPTTA